MEKKIGDILDAFQNYRFEDALRQIDLLIKKISKDSKKKNSLTDKDERIINIIKCGSLASIGKLHEANHIMSTYFTQKIISEMPPDQVFLFCSIAELAYDKNILDKIQILNKSGKSDIRLERFMLSRRMFSVVSKSFLKEFAIGKLPQDGLAQIFLEYINQFNKFQPLEDDYSKDMKIVPIKQLNLKMVQLFFMKYLSGVKLQDMKSKKLTNSILDLKLRLAINLNKQQQAKETFTSHSTKIQQPFIYLRSIRDMPASPQSNRRFYIENCGLIFQKNIEIQNYTPLYDYYNQFLDFVLGQNITKDFNSIEQLLRKQGAIVEKDKMYDFTHVANDNVLGHYYNSLVSELKGLTQGERYQTAKKSDYFKISVKGLILQRLKIHRQVALRNHSPSQVQALLQENTQFKSLLNQYFLYFAKTLTYVNQMNDYLPFLRSQFSQIFESIQKNVGQKTSIVLPNNFERQDDNLILAINALKTVAVFNKQNFQKWQEVETWTNINWACYKQFIEEIEQSKRRQKGEVFLSDQFVVLLSDILIFHIQNYSNQNQQSGQEFVQNVLIKLTAILDQTTQISPFNAYLKLRLLYVCQKMNFVDKLLDTYVSLDIKSVQFETLGYLMMNPLINFNMYAQFQHSIIKMVRSYHENQRQTSEYCLKGLKAGTTYQMYEYFSYQKRLEKSFSKILLFYSLYLQNQNQEHSQFYLSWIQDKLNAYKKQNKKVCFNCDTKTMQNTISSLGDTDANSQALVYNEYYGHLNSLQVFELQVKVRRLQYTFRQSIKLSTLQCQKLIQGTFNTVLQAHTKLRKTTKISQLYNLQSQFELIDQYLGKRQNKSAQKTQVNDQQHLSLTQTTLNNQFLFFIKLTELKICIFRNLRSFLALIKLTDKNQALENEKIQQNKELFAMIQDTLKYFTYKMTWRQQAKKCWLLRQTLFNTFHLFSSIDEQTSKIKKLPKSIKNLISGFTKQLQQAILTNTSDIKFASKFAFKKDVLNLQIDPKFIEKVFQRDEALGRVISMNQKEAKKYLSK